MTPTRSELNAATPYDDSDLGNLLQAGAAKSGAVADPDLAAVVNAWRNLPANVKASIVALAERGTGDKPEPLPVALERGSERA